MLARIATIFTISLFAMLAAASAVPRGVGGVAPPQCNGGTTQCCNQIEEATSPLVAIIAGLVDAVLDDITGYVGLTCNPYGAGGSCSQQAACCTGNNFSGVLVLGCSPININL